MEATGKEVVGVSDSGNIHLIDRIQDEFQDAKFIIVLRDVGEVVNSFKRVGVEVDPGTLDDKTEEMEWVHSTFGTPIYGFDELNESNCKKIWEYLTETEFDPQRWGLLNNLMIEVNVNYLHRKIEETKDNVKSFMGLS